MKIVKVQATSLSAPFGAADTAFTLAAFIDSQGNPVSLADWGEEAFLVVVLKQADVTEMVKCSAVTQNDDGTATFTVAASGRDLSPVSPYTGSSEGQDFSAGADAICTNDPLTMSRFATLGEDQTFAGKNIFVEVPQAQADPVEPNDLPRLSYVQTLVLGVLTTIDIIVPATAGVTITQGQLVYLDVTSGTWKLADASNAATVNNTLLGIAQGAGTASAAITGGVLLQGVDIHQTGLTTGQVEYATNTPGSISHTPGTTIVAIGIAKSATSVYFNPRFDQQLTNDQMNALAGTSGTPSSSNPFATKATTDYKVSQSGAEIYAADSVGTDAYAVTLSPVPASLVAGMVVHFKTGTANTGAASLNVNGLGAKTIKKSVSTDLATGDIAANQIIAVVYDGTNFQLLSTLPGYTPSSFMTIVNRTAEASSTQTIAHGLGKIPTYVRASGGLNPAFQGNGVYNGATTTGIWVKKDNASSGSSFSLGAFIDVGTYGSNPFPSGQSASVTFDATNIYIAWTNTGGGLGTTGYFVIEVFA